LNALFTNQGIMRHFTLSAGSAQGICPLLLPAASLRYAAWARGRSSVVERQLPKLYVVGSIPIARSTCSARSAEQLWWQAKALSALQRSIHFVLIRPMQRLWCGVESRAALIVLFQDETSGWP
jgi:hypothetical protein